MGIDNDFFIMSAKHKPVVASAFGPEGSRLAHELISELENTNQMPFEFALKQISTGKNDLVISEDLSEVSEPWLDYQPNSLAWPMFSKKLKTLIDTLLTGDENIDWITAVINGNFEQRTYYIPRFSKKLDVLNMEKTMFVPGTDQIIKPVFSSSKILSFRMFSKPSSNDLWKISSALYVSSVLKKAIEEKGLSGIVFERASLG